MTEDFRWQDGERVVRFGRGALADAGDLLGDGYVLLTTPRAAGAAPPIAAAAGRTIEVPSGRVDELAGELLAEIGDAPGDTALVALGGGRVIDVAKAIAAARRPLRVAAVPTTLSAAEMTRVHRRAAGAPAEGPGVRPAIVLNDPALSASQPGPDLAASAANALGHALEGPLTVLASPVPALAGREAARLIAGAWSGAEPDRDALALGALLSGYAIDATLYGLHHVCSQTLVRLAGIGHGPANAAMLPHTLEALGRRDRGRVEDSDVATARDLARRAGAERLRDLGIAEDALAECARAAAGRPELGLTPPPADERELLGLYEAAW